MIQQSTSGHENLDNVPVCQLSQILMVPWPSSLLVLMKGDYTRPTNLLVVVKAADPEVYYSHES